MAHSVYEGELDTPMLRIDGENYVIEFAVSDFPKDQHEWLGEVLERQVNEAIGRNVKLAIEGQQRALRVLAGLN